MASIHKLTSGRWQARYYDAAGKQHAKNFERKSDGQRWLDQVTAAVVRGDYVDPKAGRVTLKAYAAAWEAAQVSSDGTRRIVDNALRLHLVPALGTHQIATIRTTQIQGFVRQLEGKGLSPGTVRGIYHVTQQVFAAAVDDKLIAQSPCRRIRLPKSDREEVVIPTVEEVLALRDAIGERWAALVTTLAGTGVRIGELLGLQVSDVDFLRREVHVERQRRQDGSVGPVKSKKSCRVIPVGQVVIDALAAHLAAYPSRGPLFVDELGEPLVYRRWRSLAEAAVLDANRAEAAALRKRDAKAQHVAWEVTAHTLRHFYASALIRAGASVKQVQERLGHSSPVITLELYTHLWPGEDDQTRAAMDAALAPLKDSSRTQAVADA